MKLIKNKKAVSEILGTQLLLGIAISLFSLLSVIVLSYPFDPSTPSVDLVGMVDQGDIIIEHRGGERLSLDTNVVILIDGFRNEMTIKDHLANEFKTDGYWDIGEKFVYPGISPDSKVRVIITDIVSNSVIMNNIVQEGI